MADFELLRVAVVVDGAFGVLLEDGLPFAVTLERTYGAAREPQLVKVPPGVWPPRRTRYHRGGYDTYEVADVPGRSRLLFHRGNVERDSEGCVLVARCFGELGGQPGVLESGSAFWRFMARADQRLEGRRELELQVREV